MNIKLSDSDYNYIKKTLKKCGCYSKKEFKENYRHWRIHGDFKPAIKVLFKKQWFFRTVLKMID